MKLLDYTEQETLIAEILFEMGLRYEQQVRFGKYTCDFYCNEIRTVIEADGVYGHLKKADKVRDDDLLKNFSIKKVLHIKEFTRTEIKKILTKEIFINGN